MHIKPAITKTMPKNGITPKIGRADPAKPSVLIVDKSLLFRSKFILSKFIFRDFAFVR